MKFSLQTFFIVNYRAAQLKGTSKSLHFAKDVEKLITATDDLSLGPDENEFPALSVEHLSQVAAGAEDHDDSQTSLGKGEAAEEVDEENLREMTGNHGSDVPTISTRDFSTTEYLPCMLHVHSPPGILPRYSSWSLVCLGSSSLYSHNAGKLILYHKEAWCRDAHIEAVFPL